MTDRLPQHLGSRTDTSGDIWQRNLIEFVLQEVYTAWIQRTSAHDAAHIPIVQQMCRDRLSNEISQLYLLSTQCLYQKPFQLELPDLLAKPISVLEAWITVNKPIIHRGVQKYHANITHDQTTLEKYLRRKKPP